MGRLRPATASAEMCPEFVHELQDESGVNVDLREQGTIVFPQGEHANFGTESFRPAALAELEPALAVQEVRDVRLREAGAPGELEAGELTGINAPAQLLAQSVLQRHETHRRYAITIS